MEPPQLPPKAKFKAKFDLPKLPCYRGQLKAAYWSKWRKRRLTKDSVGRSWVSAAALKELAKRARNPNKILVEKVAKRLQEGADIGVGGRGRLPTRGENAEAVYENGEAISDTLQEGIVDGYLAGPYTEEELIELVGPDFSVNPINCWEKPNGKLRIIIDVGVRGVSVRAKLIHDTDGVKVQKEK